MAKTGMWPLFVHQLPARTTNATSALTGTDIMILHSKMCVDQSTPEVFFD